ncbi:MAG TPA: MmcQ/YjbR family DNA-binding protein [Candidatus Dormibacteraeota bacterium]|nr:MmcQ/YjbR family DNA-binding protein [Candidatus Dormibacteraeota bacterium]
MRFKEFQVLCLSLPEAEERETWGEQTFRVRDHIFAMGSLGGEHVSLKASLDDQSGLVEMDPKTFAPSAYTGRYGWVRVRLAGVGSDMARQLVTNAWKRTAPRRLVADYELRGKP